LVGKYTNKQRTVAEDIEIKIRTALRNIRQTGSRYSERKWNFPAFLLIWTITNIPKQYIKLTKYNNLLEYDKKYIEKTGGNKRLETCDDGENVDCDREPPDSILYACTYYKV
jgi:hypothetical protein